MSLRRVFRAGLLAVMVSTVGCSSGWRGGAHFSADFIMEEGGRTGQGIQGEYLWNPALYDLDDLYDSKTRSTPTSWTTPNRGPCPKPSKPVYVPRSAYTTSKQSSSATNASSVRGRRSRRSERKATGR